MNHQANPGVPPSNETRVRNLEDSVRAIGRRLETMLSMLKHMQRFAGGGGAGQQIIQATVGTGGFTTSDSTTSVTVRKLIQGSGSAAVNDSISVANPLAIWGTPGVYGYAGAEGTTLTAIQSADDGTWQILDIVPTVCACPCNTGTDLGSEGGGGGL